MSACSYPSLLAFCGGDEDSVVRFSGQMKAGPIRKFLEQFADGKKCRQSKWGLKGRSNLRMAGLLSHVCSDAAAALVHQSSLPTYDPVYELCTVLQT